MELGEITASNVRTAKLPVQGVDTQGIPARRAGFQRCMVFGGGFLGDVERVTGKLCALNLACEHVGGFRIFSGGFCPLRGLSAVIYLCIVQGLFGTVKFSLEGADNLLTGYT